MFKKIIYSAMALSLTLMPALDVMAEDITGDYTIDGTTHPSVTLNEEGTDTWTGGTITNTGGTLTIDGISQGTVATPNYVQSGTASALVLTDGGTLTLEGVDANYARITAGSVQVGESDNANGANLTVGMAAQIASDATVEVYAGNTITLTSTDANLHSSLVLSNSGTNIDVWSGTIYTTAEEGTSGGTLYLQGYNSDSTVTTAIYKQDAGSLLIGNDGDGNPSSLLINNQASYISAGSVAIDAGNTLTITTQTTQTIPGTTDVMEATLGEAAVVNINYNAETETPATLKLTGNGSAVINDTSYSGTEPITGRDYWSGHIQLGDETVTEEDNPVLTLRNVQKDFVTDETETATFIMDAGTLNIENNDNGGSEITAYNYYVDESGDPYYNLNGTINIRGAYGADDDDHSKYSTLNIYYGSDDTRRMDNIHLEGYSNLTLNTMEYTDEEGNTQYTNVITSAPPTGTGAANTVVKTGQGAYVIADYDGETGDFNILTDDINMGYNLQVAEGDMYVYTVGKVKVGIDDETASGVSPYGDLIIGNVGNETITNYYTISPNNTVVGNMALADGWYHQLNPGVTNIGGDMYTLGRNSGIDMMNGTIDRINIAGTNTISDDSTLSLKIDVDPIRYGTWLSANDTINADRVVASNNSVLNLTDFNLLSTPRRDYYIFRVVNAKGEKYSVAPTEQKVVTGNADRLILTDVGVYKMFPSAVRGAFDMALISFNPRSLRALVPPNVIYANQTMINNQLFDRMFYSNLPYFNGRCTNKTAAADTLYSPYQYTTEETGLWFKPYANFETIHMNYGLGKVRNNAYGAMVGVDFGRKDFGKWSFIPTAYVGYNGGRTTFNGIGMWHNGGQGGIMGTLTNGDFITSLVTYGGGYYNNMKVSGHNDVNALWNVGVASKTAYNVHLFWDLILQPTVYLAYNFIGASSYESRADGFFYKVDPMNAFSVAPGLNLIWQKETFSIYALFQAMFNIGSTTAGRVAEIDLPHVGIRDPYFEYGLGATKFFKDRFSGYGQVVARSGSRKGVGFQLGLNLKL